MSATDTMPYGPQRPEHSRIPRPPEDMDGGDVASDRILEDEQEHEQMGENLPAGTSDGKPPSFSTCP
jgi:hypothetical protein